MIKEVEIPDQVFFLKGEWLAYLDGEVLETAWDSRDAAEAGLEVERQRRGKEK